MAPASRYRFVGPFSAVYNEGADEIDGECEYVMGRGLKGLAISAVVGMFLVQLMGALVTKSGSAEGCGSSWPLCDGKLLPAANIHSYIEYSHRAVSGIVGILVVVMAVQMWRKYAHRRDVRALAFTGVLFIVIQSLLGAAAVMWPQPKTVLALHFGISLTAFSAVLLPTIIAFQLEKGDTHRTKPVSSRLRAWVWGSLIYVYAVVYSGAFVRHTNSHLACLDWPLCNGALIPPLTGEVGIQFFHRLAAGVALLVLIGLARVAAREREVRPDVYVGALWSAILMGAQVLTGGWVVLSHLTMTSMMVHSAIITALFGLLSYLCMQVSPEPARREATAGRHWEGVPSNVGRSSPH